MFYAQAIYLFQNKNVGEELVKAIQDWHEGCKTSRENTARNNDVKVTIGIALSYHRRQ